MIVYTPMALRMIKPGLNSDLDGQAGMQEFAGNATLPNYLTENAQESNNAFLVKRTSKSYKYPKFP